MKENNPVARIDILPANSPVSDEKGLKHIRFSNGTQLLQDQEIEYFKKRFPNLDILEKDVNKNYAINWYLKKHVWIPVEILGLNFKNTIGVLKEAPQNAIDAKWEQNTVPVK